MSKETKHTWELFFLKNGIEKTTTLKINLFFCDGFWEFQVDKSGKILQAVFPEDVYLIFINLGDFEDGIANHKTLTDDVFAEQLFEKLRKSKEFIVFKKAFLDRFFKKISRTYWVKH